MTFLAGIMFGAAIGLIVSALIVAASDA